MKRFLTTLCLSTVILTVFGLAHAQQPQSKPDTKAYTLNTEASKAMNELLQGMANENARHSAEVQRIADLEAALMKGAGIPQFEWDKRMFKVEADGTLSFVPKPEVKAEAAKKN